MVDTCWKDSKLKYQWQKQEKNPHIKNNTGLEYPYHKSLKEIPKTPIQGESYRYMGSSNDDFNHNHIYYVMRVEYVWFDDGLYVVLTTRVYPNDYRSNPSIDIPIKQFQRLFEPL